MWREGGLLILVLFVDKQIKRYEQNYKNKDFVVSTTARKKVCLQQLLQFKRHQKRERGKKKRQQCHTMPFLFATCSMCTPHFSPARQPLKQAPVLVHSARYFRHSHLHQLYHFQHSHLDKNTITRDYSVL